jgi:hypothetical protein
MAKPNFPTTRRYGEALAFDVPHQTADAAEDSRFLADVAKGLQARDEDETESREELKAKIRAELLNELHERLVTSPTEPPPEQAQFVRQPDEGLDAFFTLAAQQKEARRRGR